MKFVITLFLSICLLLNVHIYDFGVINAESHFDTYPNNISWKKEILRLDNFGIFLQKNPEFVGYIAFYRTKSDSVKKIKDRIERGRKYLIKRFQIDENRLVLIDAGIFESSITILQPADKDAPPPKFGFPQN